MPKIYSDEKREEVKKELLRVGLELIKKYGVKKMNIGEITKTVGIAQGTFYNFFKSKEMLVYELANIYQKKVDERSENIIKQQGYLTRKNLYDIYYSMMLEDEDNVYRFLKVEDMQNLLTRLPSECLIKISDAKSTIENNLIHVKDKKEGYNINSIINWIQVMNLTLQNKEILIEDSIEQIIKILIENMLNEIF